MRPVDHLLPLVPGLLVAAFSFEAGGFFPGATAAGAVTLVIVLILHVTLAERPFAGLSLTFLIGAVALGLLAVWTLVSVGWSDAPARALLEYDRALLYLLAFVALGLAGRTPARLRLALRGIAAAAFVVCLCGLVTRLLPDVWSVAADVGGDRLSFPLTYWNALGLLAAVGFVLCFTLSSDVAERPVGRVLAAGALPVLALTLLLTFSRGALGAGLVGLVAAVIAARARALPSALLAAVPTVAVVVAVGYGADLLVSARPTAPAAVAQGHEVAVVVGASTLVALVVRGLLLWLDRRLATLRVPRPRPAVAWAGCVAAVALVVIGAVLAGAPAAIDRQVDRFVAGNQVGGADVRDRLTSVGNNGRLDHWRVAVEGYEREPLHGTGAGTYALLWDRDRPSEFQVEDAHSLYVEMLAELGIVGLVLTGLAVGILLVGLLARARGPDRALGGALFGAALAWALHAGIDWDWEMPAVTIWLFAAGGLALAARAEAPESGAATMKAGAAQRGRRVGGRGLGRVLVALGCLMLAVVPARIFLSDGPLRESARAFERGDCAVAVERGLDAVEALASRPEPYAILGYCDVRLGVPLLGVQAMEKAIARDPRNWDYHYGLALVRGAAGLDPRPAARRALELNPRAGMAITAVRRLAEADGPQEWRRRALASQLPVD
ncbi:MAG TPA: O-antigen ligase family protein [Solirubrobacteraceae bacterium]|nr:O-antigen ligase family protein [Solirubrobacteraceae bacterium]